ncbi:MAG TPA: hemolysin family protein [Thermoanaerobaculia bacterium]
MFYLVCDAARFFGDQVSAVTLRRWSGDPDVEGGSRWFTYDSRNLQLMSGTLLQVSLILAVGATVMAIEPPVGMAVVTAAVVWLLVAIIWKFALALVPEDIGEIVLKQMIPLSHFFYYLFWPLLFPLRRMFARLEEQEQQETEAEEPTDEEVQAFIDVGEEEGILEPSEGKMIQSVVEFGDRVARELMTPRIDVLAFNARGALDDLARLFSESKYSRIPIYQESIDSITGIVHIKEVFEAILKKESKSVSELARPPYFVSETKKVSELLREFQSEHLQVAVVVDEFGGTAGIITIEDVIEEIVGDIGDEHEDIEATIVDLGNDEYLVPGLLRVETLEEMLDAHFAGEDYETVAGMIFTTLGRVPKRGTMVTKNGYRFEVDRADRRRIYRVKISRDPEWQEIEEVS